MALTRRRFVQTAGIGAVGSVTSSWIGARGRENALWSIVEPTRQASEPGVIVLASNENPLGPSATVMNAVKAAFGEQGRAPGRYAHTGDLIDAIAKKQGVKAENVVLGCGSTQILRSATHLFTATDKPLVGTIPTYEECAAYAEMMGHPVRAVALDAAFKIDLDKLADASRGAGLVFYCNPNNPTATYVGARATRDFLTKVTRESPDTTILVDEAYFDYVSGPDHDTHIPVAIENPRILVARTFSKAYSLCFQRVGYFVGHPELIAALHKIRDSYNVNGLGQIAAEATLDDLKYYRANFRKIIAVREKLSRELTKLGFRVLPSQTNFILAQPPRFPAKDWLQRLRARKILVRWFGAPEVKDYLRVTIGTAAEAEALAKAVGRILHLTRRV